MKQFYGSMHKIMLFVFDEILKALEQERKAMKLERAFLLSLFG